MRPIIFLVSVVVSILCLHFLALPSLAWEFELIGAFNWTHEWYGQQGAMGFFGPYNVDNGATTRAANLNFWNGNRFDTNITTGAKANWSYFNVELLPKIKINEAIRLSAKLRLGTYNDPISSDYHTYDAPGVNRSFSGGQWTMFWVTAQTPLGSLGIGKRPWIFGTGLQYDGAEAATTESVAIVAPFGPVDLGIAFYPYRFIGSSSIASVRWAADSRFVPIVGDDQFNSPLYALADGTLVTGQYFSRADTSGTAGKDFLAFVTYYDGPLHAGILGSYTSYHIGSEALLIDPK